MYAAFHSLSSFHISNETLLLILPILFPEVDSNWHGAIQGKNMIRFCSVIDADMWPGRGTSVGCYIQLISRPAAFNTTALRSDFAAELPRSERDEEHCG